MFIAKACFVFVLYIFFDTPSAEIVPSIDEKVEKHVAVDVPDDAYELHVRVGKKPRTAGIDLPSSRMPNLSVNKTHAFYTALSCNVAYLTVNSLYDFVASSPLFYQHKYRRYDAAYDTEFRWKFDESFRKLVQTVGTDTSHYIRILNNVVLSTDRRHSSYYADQSTLESLLALRIKVYMLSRWLADDGERRPASARHRDVLRAVLIEMNDVQRSLLFNCKRMATDGSNSQFYGYYVQTVDANRRLRTDFLDRVEEKIALTAADGRTACTASQITLEEFAPRPTEPAGFKRDIFAAIVMTAADDDDADDGARENAAAEVRTIRDVYERMKTARAGRRAAFVYQHSVVAAIVKTMVGETLACLKNGRRVCGDIPNAVRAAHERVSADDTGFPRLLVDGLAMLYGSGPTDGGGDLDATYEQLERFHDSLNDVRLKTTTGTDRPDDDNWPYLEALLNAVTNAIASFECFQESYRSSLDRHQRYYLPFANVSETRRAPNRRADAASRRVCDFAVNVYSLCFQAQTFAQNADGRFYDRVDGNERLGGRLAGALNSLQHYFLLIIRKIADERLLRTAYAVAPMLVNIARQRYPCAWDTENVLRAVMAEMNSVAARHCRPDDGGNLSLFNRMNFAVMGNKRLMDESMEEFFSFFRSAGVEPSDLTAACIDANEFEYFNVDRLYANYVENSLTVRAYENVVKFYWDGRARGIRHVYEDGRLALKGSDNFYALIDVYLKFFAAAAYHEIRSVFLKGGDADCGDGGVAELDRCCGLAEDAFPRPLRPLVSDVNGLLRSLSNARTKSEIHALVERTDDRFRRFGVVFDEPASTVRASFGRFGRFCAPDNGDEQRRRSAERRRGTMKHELSEFVRQNGDLFESIGLMNDVATTPS